MKIIITRYARLELDQSAQYYEGRRPGLAADFIREFEKTYERIKVHPLSGSQFCKTIRYQLLNRFPYSVYYIVDGEVITVLAVAHQHRKPGYWQDKK